MRYSFSHPSKNKGIEKSTEPERVELPQSQILGTKNGSQSHPARCPQLCCEPAGEQVRIAILNDTFLDNLTGETVRIAVQPHRPG